MKLLLLIVPYGIETKITTNKSNTVRLLIVPYGIETISYLQCTEQTYTFNCTLWN